MRSQHPTANNRNFRSLVFPWRNSSIGLGSSHASHSCSVMQRLGRFDLVAVGSLKQGNGAAGDEDSQRFKAIWQAIQRL
jgi:hypothetical protein